MTHVLRGIFAIKDIQRAPGNSGVLNRFKDHDRPELNYAYLDENKFVTPWPNSLSVVVSCCLCFSSILLLCYVIIMVFAY